MGLSSSSQARMSVPKRISSGARASSNAGQTQATSPSAGSTMTNVCSEGHHRTPLW
ncbi:MAG TPA: hypothetical protein VGA78_03685 [Gemmatimonadales bacterium]